MLFARVVLLEGVSEYGDHTAQAQEGPLDSGVTSEAFVILGSKRSANDEYVAMVTS